MDFKLEYLLLFVIAIFLLYHLLGGCGCANGVDGFSVGGQPCNINCCGSTCATKPTMTDMCNRLNILNDKIDILTNHLTQVEIDIQEHITSVIEKIPVCRNKF